MINLLKLNAAQSLYAYCAFNKLAFKIVPVKKSPPRDAEGKLYLPYSTNFMGEDHVVGPAVVFKGQVFVGDFFEQDESGMFDESMHPSLENTMWKKNIIVPENVNDGSLQEGFGTAGGYFLTRREAQEMFGICESGAFIMRYYKQKQQQSETPSPYADAPRFDTPQDSTDLVANNKKLTAYANLGEFPVAGQTVDGLAVTNNIPNLSSIRSSLTNYTVLKGIREVPITDWTPQGMYSTNERDRIHLLAQQIQTNKRIDPLIMVVEQNGDDYILEGGHRINALKLLGAKAFPALVVIDSGD